MKTWLSALSTICLAPSIAWAITVSTVTPTPQTNYPTPQPGMKNQYSILQPIMNWQELCFDGQFLNSKAGCTPDCSNPAESQLCNLVLQTGQIEQRTGIQPPYQSNGVVVFALPQVGIAKTATFNLLLHNSRNGFGYVCEILNADATPAVLWDTVAQAYANVILMDNNSASISNKSNNFVKIAVQGLAGGGYWTSDSNNPLYLVCLSYLFTSNSYIQSTGGCGGTGAGCISFTLQ